MCSHARSRLRLPIAGCACELCRRPYGEHWLKLERYREDQHGRCARMLAHIEKSTPSLTQQSALRSRWLVADLAHDVGALVGRRWWWRAVPGWVGEGWGVREGFGVGSGLRGCRHGWTPSRFCSPRRPATHPVRSPVPRTPPNNLETPSEQAAGGVVLQRARWEGRTFEAQPWLFASIFAHFELRPRLRPQVL